jgi:prepilin peptidase CpaA
MSLEFANYHLSVLLIAAGLMIAAAVIDARSYRIPNMLCLALIVLFPLFVLTAPRDIMWQQHLMVFAFVLVIGLAMFSGNLAGAGDIKLLAAIALWTGANYIGVLLVITGLAGGLLSLSMGAIAWRQQHRAGNKVSASSLSKVPIPYGVAIAAGGLASLGMMAWPIITF